jgi:peptidoglycan hydrolase CwlO-like protein
MSQVKKPPQIPQQTSMLERVLLKLLEALLTYVLLGGVLFIGTSTIILGHVPNRHELNERIQHVRDLMQKSTDVISGIEKTNAQLQSLGPQLMSVTENLEKMGQRITDLEQEVARLKSGQHQ